VVESGGLENRCALTGTVGSNPTLSANLVRTPFTSALLASLIVLAASVGAAPATDTPARQTCDQACLTNAMDGFVASLTQGRASTVPLADHAEIRENTKVLRLDETTWRKVKAVRSILTFADPFSGNVVSRAGVELADGNPGYLSTRLKVTGDGRITDVEISADTSPSVVSAYVWHLDPVFTAVVPPQLRLSRVELEALARRYFHSLSSHEPVTADFGDECNRFHSGQQITNVARNAVEGGAALTCASSLAGSPPWGPATEERFPVVDPERGIVFAVTLLHFLKSQPPAQMYVSELFKVVGGRIVRIDNIGLMMQGVTTLGFVH
jgi:hypothetical protein